MLVAKPVELAESKITVHDASGVTIVAGGRGVALWLPVRTPAPSNSGVVNVRVNHCSAKLFEILGLDKAIKVQAIYCALNNRQCWLT